MASLRFPIVLLDAGDTLIGPRESFGAVYRRVLLELGVDASAADLESGLRASWAGFNRTHTPGIDRYGMHPGGEDAYWLRFVEGTLARTPGLSADPDLASRALAPLREAFRDARTWQVFDDVVPVLAALRALGVRLGVVSNWDSRLPALLDTLELSPWFETLAVSHVEGVEKPSPELFLRALRRLGGRPEDALHVGDAPELDGVGARAAGIEGVLVDRHGRLPEAYGALRDLSSIPKLVRNGVG
jgi:putative hydrolase of the HAD superfamily